MESVCGRETRAGEAAMPVVLRINRPSSTTLTQAVTMYFDLSGTATFSTDYTLATGSYSTYNKYGSISIPANRSYVDLKFNIVDDDITEAMETIVVTLLEKLPNGTATGYTPDSQRTLTGYIIDNDGWQVGVTTLQSGKETKTGETAQPVKFRITRGGETNPAKAMTVYYTLSGTANYSQDYSIAPRGIYNTYEQYGSVTIPANRTYVDLSFNVVDDTLAEGTETVVLSILSDSVYTSDKLPRYRIGPNGAATAEIKDNDVCWDVSVEPLTAYAAETKSGETAQPAKYRFTRSGASDLSQSLKVYYDLAGTATKGSDYTAPTDSEYDYGGMGGMKYFVTIPAGRTSVDLTLNIIDDMTVEEWETILVRLLPAGSVNTYQYGAKSQATVILQDNDGVIQVSAGGPYTVDEGGTVQPDAKKPFDPFGAGDRTYVRDPDGDNVFGETGTVAKNGNEVGRSVIFSAVGLNGPMTKTVKVKATDTQNHTAVGQVEITVKNVAPEITPGGPATGVKNTTYTWSGSFIDPGADTWSGKVDYGDGSAFATVTLAANKTFSFTHKYVQDGVYTIRMIIKDGEAESVVTKRVMIGAVAPVMTMKVDNAAQAPVTSNSTVVAFPSTQYGTAQVLPFQISNTGKSDLTLDFSQYALPKGVSFYRLPAVTTVAAGEKVSLSLKWDGLAAITSGSVVKIVTNMTTNPEFVLKLSGTLSGTATVPVVEEFKLLKGTNSDTVSYNPIVTGKVTGNFNGSSVRVDGYGGFTVNLPAGLEYGQASTIQVRAATYSTTEKMNLLTAWASLSVTPVPPEIDSISWTNASTKVSGTLKYGAVDGDYCEVELYTVTNGVTTVHARTWCGGSDDDDSMGYGYAKFEAIPQNLPTGTQITLWARTVKAKQNGALVYGVAKSSAMTYSPTTPAYVSGITLDFPKTNNTTRTDDPSVTAKASVKSGTDVMFEFAYSTDSGSTRSTEEMVQGYATGTANTTNDDYEASYRISGLHTITTATQAVRARSRTAVWDAVKGDYVYGSRYNNGSGFSFTYEKPVDTPVVLQPLKPANPLQPGGTVTTDPTIVGKVTNDGEPANLQVEIFKGTTLLGTTTTDASGEFYYTASGLTVGSNTLSVKVREWNSVTRQYRYSENNTNSNPTFMLQKATVIAPTVKMLGPRRRHGRDR
jgi:hypothetical protein